MKKSYAIVLLCVLLSLTGCTQTDAEEKSSESDFNTPTSEEASVSLASEEIVEEIPQMIIEGSDATELSVNEKGVIEEAALQPSGYETEESNNAGELEDVNIEESIDIKKEGDENLNSNQSTEMNQQSLQAVNSGMIEAYSYGSEGGSNACDISDINELYNFLNGLNYKIETCDGLPEYKVTFDGNEIFYINLTDKWVWKDKEEASLSDSEVTLIMSCIDSSPKK